MVVYVPQGPYGCLRITKVLIRTFAIRICVMPIFACCTHPIENDIHSICLPRNQKRPVTRIMPYNDGQYKNYREG